MRVLSKDAKEKSENVPSGVDSCIYAKNFTTDIVLARLKKRNTIHQEECLNFQTMETYSACMHSVSTFVILFTCAPEKSFHTVQ
jgi:hypothetical protein